MLILFSILYMIISYIMVSLMIFIFFELTPQLTKYEKFVSIGLFFIAPISLPIMLIIWLWIMH